MIMSTLSSEIAIIGAGPGGITTSIFLSRAGIKHILFEKAEFPRDKVCGDALSGKVVAVLNKIDPEIIRRLEADEEHYTKCWGVQFIAPNGKALDIPFRKEKEREAHAPGFIGKRIDFDNFLFRMINREYATVKTGCAIRDIEKTDQGVEIYYTEQGTEKVARAQVVVGAEGDRSIVARKLACSKRDPRYYAAGLRAYYKNITGMHPGNYIELHYLKEVLPGYLWIFPLPNNEANVGLGLLSSRVKDKELNLRKMMLKALHEHPSLKKRFAHARLLGDIKGWGLPLGSVKRTLAGERFLLVGDAGSLIDPFTGEGIGNAMVSGRLAAQVLAGLVEKKDYSAEATGTYQDQVYGKLWNELKLSHTLQRLVDYPWLYNWVVNKANKNETVRDTFTFMFDDLNMRAKLKSPAFYFKLLFG